MKYNFKQIAALGVSALLIGMTAMVGAANYPDPFDEDDVGIVYGTGTGVSDLDLVQAGNIQEDLGISGSTISVEGGEAFALDKTSDHFNLGDALNVLYSTLDEDEMTFLAEGEYDDGDIEEDYEQEILLAADVLELFADTDYEDDTPTIGFVFSSGDHILNYSVTYDSGINMTDMVGTDLPILGSEYYVLAAAAAQIDILDTADSQVLLEGQTTTVTVGGTSYTVGVAVFSDGARFTVNGETSEKVADGEYDEVLSDVYVVAKSVDYVSKDTGTSQVEFALGIGKLELISGEEIELNTDDIDGLESQIITSNSLLDSIVIEWYADDDTWLTEDNSITIPELGTISLAFGGLDFPADPEEISFDNGETLTLSMENYDIPIAYFAGGAIATAVALGEEDHLLNIAVDTNYSFMEAGFGNNSISFWDGTNYTTGAEAGGTDALRSSPMSATGVNLSEDERIIVTRIDTDLTDVETAYYEVKKIDIDDGSTYTVELEDQIGSNDLTFDEVGDTDEAGDITFALAGFTADNTSAIFNFSAGGDTLTYNSMVSEKGLVVSLPDAAPMTYFGNGTGYTITLREADKDDDVNSGDMWTVNIQNTSNDRLHVSTHNLTADDEEESDDNFIGWVASDLATAFTYDISADENDYDIKYYGEEVTADVQVVAGGEVSSEAVGGVLVKDTEVSSVSDKNLIVVGGSCINSVAANLVGGAYCGSGWTDETDVGSGQFLIQSFGDAYTTGKIALLVAGYDVSDTVNAATYLTTQTVDTTAGKKYIGTTETQATLQVE